MGFGAFRKSEDGLGDYQRLPDEDPDDVQPERAPGYHVVPDEEADGEDGLGSECSSSWDFADCLLCDYQDAEPDDAQDGYTPLFAGSESEESASEDGSGHGES